MTREKGSFGVNEAAVEFTENGLRSRTFADVYFSVDGGPEETRHVFLEGVGAPDLWRQKPRTVIGELGFGSGLNFLTTWAAWRRTAPADARLDFVSVEGYPLAADQLARSLEPFPELSDMAQALVRRYPGPVPGYHRLWLERGRVGLTLLFGPVERMLDHLLAQMDAWYLDGFAPAKNPGMWTPAVMAQVARCSRPGARIATFTVARAVRDALGATGFEVEKRPGFGRKRDCLAGVFTGRAEMPRPALDPGQTVEILGRGVAGAALVSALKTAGLTPRLVGGGEGEVAGASHIPRASVTPRVAAPSDAYGRFMAQAFLHACRALEGLAEDAEAGPWLGERGALRLFAEEADRARQLTHLAGHGWGEGLARPVSAEEASDIAGIRLTRPGIHFPGAGALTLGRIWRALGEMEEGGQGGAGVPRIIAAGAGTAALVPALSVHLRANRGQVAYVSSVPASEGLRIPISFGGHLLPPSDVDDDVGSTHILGATYAPEPDPAGGTWRRLRADDHAAVLAKAGDVSRELADAWASAPLRGWTGLRATTADHLPMVGPVEGEGGKRGREDGCPVCVLTGLGSHGFQTAFLAAEILAADLTGAPSPVPRDVAAALRPGRFAERAARRAAGRRSG